MDIEIVQDISAKAPQARVAARPGFAGAADAFAAKLLSLAGPDADQMPGAPLCRSVGAAPDHAGDQPDRREPPADSDPVPDQGTMMTGPDVATAQQNLPILVSVADHATTGDVDPDPCTQVPESATDPRRRDAATLALAMPADRQPGNVGAECRLAAPAPDRPTHAPQRSSAVGDGSGSGNREPTAPEGQADAAAKSHVVQDNGRAALPEIGSPRSESHRRPAQSGDQVLTGPLPPANAAAEMVARQGAGAPATQGTSDGTEPSDRQTWTVAQSGRHDSAAVSPEASGSDALLPLVTDIGGQTVHERGSPTSQKDSHHGETFAGSKAASEKPMPKVTETGGDAATGNAEIPARLPQGSSARAQNDPAKALTNPLAEGAVPPPLPHVSVEPDRATVAANAAHRPLPPGIAHQLAVNISHRPGREVEITLSPEELGKVRMTVSAAEGTLTLTLTAARADTLDLLRRHIDQLAQDFRDLGFDRLNFSFFQDRDDRAPEAEIRDTPADADPAHRSLPAPDHVRPTQQATLSGGLDIRL